jgi:hypothetical protein|tara:strand:+ start:412 stop:861 length:450 start_codon:yes stop_codon:yes gene_type:complete
MSKRRKRCPKCKELNEPDSTSCASCGGKIKKTKIPKATKPFAKERKEFISRMLDGEKPKAFALDMMAVTRIFQIFVGHEDFLSKVAPPFKLKDSIKYLLSSEGMKYLRKKKDEFYYKPKKLDKIIDFKEKVGEDTLQSKTLTLRDFLNE